MSISFEEKINQIEEIVKKLESGALSLDESIELYSKGIVISAECRKTLDEAQLKLTEAKSSFSEEK